MLLALGALVNTANTSPQVPHTVQNIVDLVKQRRIQNILEDFYGFAVFALRTDILTNVAVGFLSKSALKISIW